jgi:hypothetical protein
MSCIAPDTVQEAFLASPPLIAQEILDLTVRNPNFLRDMFQVEEWPRGQGTIMEQLIFRGAMPQIERGFDNWKRLANISGCEPCEGPDCSYNWTTFGGHGWQRKQTTLMEREFRSPSYCINEIQTTAHFREVFAKIVENLYAQINFFKEMNIGQNFLTGIAKKYVIDSQGAKCNTNNPYVYRNTGGVRLSTLNIEMLTFFYENMRRMPDVVPYDVVDGSPIYSMLVSAELMARLYRDDNNLRQDVRFSGLANDLLMKYNFMSTVRGMFIVAPILYPRRFNLDAAFDPVEVLPFVNGVPGDVGSYTYLNPAYESASYEEVILHGKWPFKVFFMPTETSLGENTSFGPEFSYMNSWLWVNPMTICDPFRRVGYFASSAKIGLSQQFSEGVFGILVERPSAGLMAIYTPNPVCPVDPPVCTNVVPDVTCPCPIVLSISANPFAANSYYFTFATAVTGAPTDPVTLAFDNGAPITGELVQISADGLTAEISFTEALPGGACAHIVSVFCVNTLGCSATVASASDCRSNQTGVVKLILSNAIRATDAGDIITAFFGDCTTCDLEVVSIDASQLEWTVQYAPGCGPTDDPDGAGYTVLSADMLCDRGGIKKVCVPPTTDANCPACDQTTTPCVNVT